ncbi:hypothetical protein GCM10023198_07770 [Promicromonospora umidemergens]|uniref:Uncharacterized protein n=1 Tax=Promicromonospora umidemergens TaxID=629679 RepID=A0ABP8WPH6_9MICO
MSIVSETVIAAAVASSRALRRERKVRFIDSSSEICATTDADVTARTAAPKTTVTTALARL